MRAAVSFEIVGGKISSLRRVLEKSVQDLGGRVGGAVVFVCGSMEQQIHEIANVVRDMAVPAPVLLAGGAGVMTERGCHERTSACVGLLWQSGHSVPFVVDHDERDPLARSIAGVVGKAVQHAGPTALFVSQELLHGFDVFDSLVGLPVFGGGLTDRSHGAIVAGGTVMSADVLGLSLHGAGMGVVRASPGCQLLAAPQPVTGTEGHLLLAVGGRPVLEVLRAQSSTLVGERRLVLAVFAGRPGGQLPRFVLRCIRGIDEARKGVVVAEPIPLGANVAFAVLDGAAAAGSLEATLREVVRETRGGMPRFGFYVDCAARGPHVYGEADVDVRLLRRCFPGLPIVGISSALEIGPGLTGPAAHVYSGVFTLVYSPS
jgi:small ligand-binding sensory domain FIST